MFDLAQIKRAHADLIRQTEKAVDRETEEAGRFAENYVHAHPTFTPRTGKLQDSTGHKVLRLSSGRILRITNKAKYAAAIDQGSKAHLIVARRASALRFMWKGQLMFRRWVWHPGTRPRKFLWRATFAAGRILEQGLESKMAAIARKF